MLSNFSPSHSLPIDCYLSHPLTYLFSHSQQSLISSLSSSSSLSHLLHSLITLLSSLCPTSSKHCSKIQFTPQTGECLKQVATQSHRLTVRIFPRLKKSQFPISIQKIIPKLRDIFPLSLVCSKCTQISGNVEISLSFSKLFCNSWTKEIYLQM